MGELQSGTNSKIGKEQVDEFLDIQYIHPGNASDLERQIVGVLNVLIKDYKDRYNVE